MTARPEHVAELVSYLKEKECPMTAAIVAAIPVIGTFKATYMSVIRTQIDGMKFAEIGAFCESILSGAKRPSLTPTPTPKPEFKPVDLIPFEMEIQWFRQHPVITFRNGSIVIIDNAEYARHLTNLHTICETLKGAGFPTS